ncbi:N-acetylmuramoyl-L-alanine amidase [Pedobacter montanisoli]|uniref:N-acetylmuramoyl-L-alanine amidase n=1 Tax=Pedobacter montanisoli TaxID=2923277 RepID=A0ABS9ZUW7_9SPHI|nr:N-acetylmuramoyl-L-alanine amidase [Pedobacter montanisoli]MCJ0741789.1 N-acetylmuramoyl-L-alanine amidase [Pedobacter montanisoli]
MFTKNTFFNLLKRNLVAVSGLSLVLFIGSCSTSKYAATDKVYKQNAKNFSKIIKATPPENQHIDSLNTSQYFVGTTNMGIRKPNFVIIHHTAQDSLAQTIRTFTLTRTGTSAHYVVSRDGSAVQMVNDYLRAQHAGAGKWGNVTDMNSCSIGIEMDNNGTTDVWTDAQINSLCALLAGLKKKYSIPTANFIGHADFAPGRKNDPKNFPWKKLAEKGYGLWFDDVLETPPADFDTTNALRIIGYDVRKLNYAIEAFKIHFIQTDITQTLTDYDKSVLYNLYKKYM